MHYSAAHAIDFFAVFAGISSYFADVRANMHWILQLLLEKTWHYIGQWLQASLFSFTHS